MPIHIRPTAPIAPDALLPGDPGRALALAQSLLTSPRMSNHHRGLWGYYGVTAEGRPLTIQSTGMGGPSAAIVFHELASLGITRAIRVGTCGALADDVRLGQLLVADAAVCADGTSSALGAKAQVEGESLLADSLETAVGKPARRGLVVSSDLFYADGPLPAPLSGWRELGAIAIEMEAAALFQLGLLLGVSVGCLLAVSDLLNDESGESSTRIGDEELAVAAERMGQVAARALGG